MTYEIVKCANGYIVRPAYDYSKGCSFDPKTVYVFESYSRMMDKLLELLDKEPK